MAFCEGSYLSGSSVAGTYTKTGGIDYSSFYNKEALDKKYDYNQTKESYEIEYAAQDSVLDSKISNIISYIEDGKEDKAYKAYEALVNEMGGQTRYSSLNDSNSQINAVARELLEQKLASTGYEGDLEDFIRENTDNSFQRGFSINWNGDEMQEEDLLLQMCDIDDTSRFDGVEKAAGTTAKVATGTAAGAAAGAATGAAIGAIFGGVGAAPGALIGAAIGGVGSLLTSLL